MRKVLKISLYIIGSILLLLVVAIAALNTPWGQNFVRGKAEAFLNKKLKTEVRIGHLGYGLPKFIVLNDVMIRDQARDTLLSVNTLKVDVAMLELLHHKLDLQLLVLNGVHSHVYRNMPDTTYNFSYIVDAFAGKKKEPKPEQKKDSDTSGTPFEITVGKVTINDIHARLDDQTGGMKLAIDLEHLGLQMNKLDLDEMRFHIKELQVAGLKTLFAQDTSYLPLKTKTDTGKTQLHFIADNVHLERIDLNYTDVLNKLLFALNLGTLDLDLKNFDLAGNSIDINKLAVANTKAVLTIGKHANAPAVVDTIVKKDTTEGWIVKAHNLDLSGLAFKMDNENEARVKKGIDYGHFDLKDLALKLNNLSYTSDSISGNVRHLAVKEKSGVDLKELKTNFIYNQQGATLNNLYLLTPHTLLKDHLEVHYASVSSLKNNAGAMLLNIDLKQCLVGLEDVLIFAPQLADQQQIFRKYPKAMARLDARLTGRLDNMNIARLYLKTLSNTELDVNGHMNGLPNANALRYNLHIAKLNSSRAELEEFVPDSVLSSIRVPDRFGVSGDVSGTIKDYNTDLIVMSTDGTAYLKGTLAMSPGKGRERYDMLVQTRDLNLGRILKQDSVLGTVSAAIKAKGTGFDPKKAVATIEGAIASAYAKGYRYHDVTFNAVASAGKAAIKMKAQDPNLRMHMTGNADFTKDKPAIVADIQLDSIDFQALKLYNTELRARGTIKANFPVLDPDYPKGVFTWTQPIINADGKRYYLDSMYIVSAPNDTNGQNINAYLQVVSAHITGKMPLTKIGAVVQERINRRYSALPKDTAGMAYLDRSYIVSPQQLQKDTTVLRLPNNYDLKLTASITDAPMLHSIIPGLTTFDSIHVDGSLDPRSMLLNVDIPEVVYGNNTIEKALIKVSGTDSAFTYKVTVDKISAGSLALWYADIHGNLDQNLVTANVSVSDSLKKERFALAANMQNQGADQVITLKEGLKLDYNTWTVAPANKIVLTKGGYYIQNFEIGYTGQYIRANSDSPAPDAPLKIDIGNFRLTNLTNIISKKDTALADGILAGKVTMQKGTNGDLQMDADMGITGLSVLSDTLGDLKALVNNKTANTLDAKVTLTGFGNDIAITGNYYTAERNGNDFEMQVAVKALALHSFESLAMNQIKNSTGYIRGDLHLTGTASAPKINGQLKTDNLRTTITTLNSNFKFPAETIKFNDDVITFNKFNILDSPDNKATIDGSVNIKELTNPTMDLDIKAKNWRAVHSTAKDNKTFYGDLYMTTNLTLKGTPSAPTVDGSLNVLKGTNLTIVTPEKEPEIESRKGIVKFVNGRDSALANLLIPKKKDTTTKRRLAKGSDINVNVVVDKNAQFSLVIDQANGDFLSVRGDASLNASLGRNGTIALTGNYELHEGAYQFNYNFIKRRFQIKDGSIITFAGDPVNGTRMDITATYQALVPPYDLVQRQVPDQAALNYYKQRIPFDIELYLKGQVLKPAISFNVSLPDNKIYPLASDQIELVQGKLSQIRTDTSELNKQVFAVLILGRFVSDDPFHSDASSSLSATAMQSVSTFIGEQLNKAAGRFVKGVDLSVDLATTEDYTTGDLRQRTDLNVAASKRLLNDRLKLTVGNNFELEGPQTTNQQTSYVPSNLAADYLLSADGKYTVRGYRSAYDEGVLQGYVTETGVNFIVSLDYNKFTNVFKKKNKKVTDTTRSN